MYLNRMSIVVERTLESLQNKFFIGGDFEDQKIPWIAWRKCLASRDLKFGSLLHIYFEQISFNQMDLEVYDDLWVRFIKNIHGVDGCIRC